MTSKPPPTHCRSCNVELEPTRRYAGLCAKCVAEFMRRNARPQAARPSTRVARRFVRNGVKSVVVKCSCGARRTMKASAYDAQRPECCNACRLQAVDRYGFEPEMRGGGR